MRILAIETSCDETSASVVQENLTGGIDVCSIIIATSLKLHASTGGIIPERAARAQIEYIIPVIDKALTESGFDKTEIDAIAVTHGPGLIGSLLVGIEAARTLSFLWQKPLIKVNHLLGHLYANFIAAQVPQFPAIGLVVSGGHTDLIYMKSHNQIKYLGGTRDDAAGEAFDKTARLLGLGYPGGPMISKASKEIVEKGTQLKYFPRPMRESGDYDFSFSGLKTAVLREVKANSKFTKNEMAAQIQEAIVDVLVYKADKACIEYMPKSFLLAGGVAANERLRDKINQKISKSVKIYIPPVNLCTDNAAYIGACAYYHPEIIDWTDLTPNPELTIV